MRDEKARLDYSDHPAPGNTVFACETVIEEFDNETGLALWQE